MQPRQPADFIGKTHIIAKALFRKAEKLKRNPEAFIPIDRCWLFTGDPGTGKTSLAEALAAELSGHPLAIEQLNGQSCDIATVRGWKMAGGYRPLFGDLSVKLVDEIDAASLAACNELRTYLDKLPPSTVFLATTNRPISGLQEQLQSRFKVQYFEPVPVEAITTWLVGHFKLSPDVASRLASGANGNVRAAKADALSYIEVSEAL